MIQLDFKSQGYDDYYVVNESRELDIRLRFTCNKPTKSGIFIKSIPDECRKLAMKKMGNLVVLFDEDGNRLDLITINKVTSQGIKFDGYFYSIEDEFVLKYKIIFKDLPKTVKRIRFYLASYEGALSSDISKFKYELIQRGLVFSKPINNRRPDSSCIAFLEFTKSSDWSLSQYNSFLTFKYSDLIVPTFNKSTKSKTSIKEIEHTKKKGILDRAIEYIFGPTRAT